MLDLRNCQERAPLRLAESWAGFIDITPDMVPVIDGSAIEGLVMRSNTFTTAESIVLDGEFKTTNGVVIGAPCHIDMRLLRADLSC